MNLALLQSKAENPVAQLITAIEKIISDLGAKAEKYTQDFDKRTGEHQNEVKRLKSEIDNANSDVSRTDSFLKEVLAPMKVSLEEDIARLNAEIAKTRIFLEEAAIQRGLEHEAFAQKILDIDGGLSAIQEALTVLDQLNEGGASFAQIKKAKTSLSKVQRVLSKNTDAALVKALVQVATSSEFTDQALLKKLLDMLHNVSESLKTTQGRLTAEENAAQEDYTKLVKAKEEEIKQYEADIIDKQGSLAATIKKIETSEAFLVARKADAISFTKELESENTSYENDTKIYEDIMAQIAKEDAVCREALSIVQGAEFADYIADRVN